MSCCLLGQDFLLRDVVKQIDVLVRFFHHNENVVWVLEVVQQVDDVLVVHSQQQSDFSGNSIGTNLDRQKERNVS